MTISDYFKWNKRFSMVYAIGAWTLCGSLAYYKFAQKEPLVTAQPIEVEEKENVKKYESTFHKTTVTYKENFVPFSSRVLNFLKGLSAEDSPASSKDQKEEK